MLWKRYQSLSQSLGHSNCRTCLSVLQCSVFSSRSLMAATAGWHCKQPSHLCVNGRADVSTTESLPPSCSYMRPQQHPSLPLPPLQREALSLAESPQHCGQEKCSSSRVRMPSLALIVANVLGSKLFFICWFNTLQHNAICINLVGACFIESSLCSPLMHSFSALKHCAYEIIHRAKSSWSHPTYNPSILLAAIWLYYFGEADGARFATTTRTSEWPERLRAPLTPVTGLVALSWH